MHGGGRERTPGAGPGLRGPLEAGRWPAYADAVVQQAQVRAIFAMPLQWGAVNLGVLDLYRWRAGSLPRMQLRDATSAAHTTTLMLLGLRIAVPSYLADVEQIWDRTWGSHAEIHQATGMVLAHLGITATDAFAGLRAHAFAENRLLGDVARDVVARRLQLTEDQRPTRSEDGT